MSSQVVSGITDEFIDEGETFNFNNWVIQNDLVSIKDLFVKHDATTLSTLKNFTSPQLQAVMTDKELFLKPQMMVKIMNAVPKLLLSTTYFTSLHRIYVYVFDTVLLQSHQY